MTVDMTLTGLRSAYKAGWLSPAKLTQYIRLRAEQYADHNIWIHLLSEAEQQPYLDALTSKDPDSLPLWGIPFAIKDNIDLAGIPTTAGCPEFSCTPGVSAYVVQQLIDAGAIPIGKTNLDQFATGLNGTRSPYGVCQNAFDSAYISGGSSSGSAVSVALGLASFSLGTDTAGSGRVPACFNNLVGVKPSRGLLSTTGVVPACRSLDCVSIFALTTDDAHSVLACAEGPDRSDAFSRSNPFDNGPRHYGVREGALRLGIIPEAQLTFFGDEHYATAYRRTLEALTSAGVTLVETDYTAFAEAARLLYEGPWVAERYIACREILETQPEAVHPVVRDIIAPGNQPKATDLFRALYRLEALKRHCGEQLNSVDCLLTPTAGRLFRIEEMLAEPIKYNSDLGYYTNFMNLLDLASVAVPTAFAPNGLPFGITLVSKRFTDRTLLSIANRFQQALQLPLGALDQQLPPTVAQPIKHSDHTDLVVCGAHLEGLPLNWQLIERGAYLKQRTTTAPGYALYALPGGPPERPALVRDPQSNACIEVEVWAIPTMELGSFVANIPAPLGIGKVELMDSTWASGFICEAEGIRDAQDISRFGGWRNWLRRDV